MPVKKRSPKLQFRPDDHESFMRLAIGAAQRGVQAGQTPFGATIVKNGRVICSVHNVVWKTLDITAHAEVHAIRTACRKLKTADLSGCIIYSTCEPCPMCFSACHWARISKIYYGARIEDAQAAGFNELTISNEQMRLQGGSPIEVIGDFLRDEAVELFRFWQHQHHHRVY